MPSEHAALSASGSKLWLASPGAHWMEEMIPDTTSPFAEEGTTAHSMVEIKLKRENSELTKSVATRRLNKLKKSEYYTKSMDDYTDQHCDLVMEAFNGAKSPIMAVEQRVDFSEWVPGGFGTSDTIILSDDGLLSIFDLKYGKGVPVDADWNPQLMLYALGSWNAFNMLGDITRVSMTIDQPRLGNVSTFEMDIDDLLDWAEKTVKPAAFAAVNGHPEFDFTDGNTWRWYKAAGFDRHLAEQCLKIRKYKFREANSLTTDEISDILSQADDIERWLKAVKEYALDGVYSGKLDLPGWKVVEGRSNRRITDEAKAIKILETAGYKPDEFNRAPALKTITDLGKLLGPKKLNSVLAEVIEKPQGKPTLAPETDKRPAMNGLTQAQDDFDDDIEGDK